jgi:phosphoglycolate phosphatase-like HAD superfamily hydrolase
MHGCNQHFKFPNLTDWMLGTGRLMLDRLSIQNPVSSGKLLSRCLWTRSPESVFSHVMNLAIFDIDGTLTLGTSHFRSFVAALEAECGFRSVSPNWKDYTHPSDSGIVAQVSRQQAGRELSSDELQRFKDRYLTLLREACRREARAVNGAAEFLRSLDEDAGWTVAYATGNWHATARCKLAAAGLPANGFPLAGAEDGESRVAILRAAIDQSLERSGVKTFERIVSFGDALWDLEAARELRVPFVGLETTNRGAEMTAAGASHLLPDYGDRERTARALAEAGIPA